MMSITLEHGSLVVECWILNRESPGSNPFAAVSKFGHFRCSLHDARVHSAVIEYLAKGNGGGGYELIFFMQ